MEAAKIISSYSKSVILPIKPERNLEDFFINRFGSVLYQKFFKTYTEKVWGTSCKNLSPEWGVQRVKNLSVSKALVENIKKVFSVSNDLAQKNTETSLIEKFLYPKYGPGQLWEKVANDVSKMGGTILRSCEATRINITGNRVKSATVINRQNKKKTIVGDYFFSSMSVKDLVGSIDPGPPSSILKVSDGLQYRDFLVVGLLLNKMQVGDESQKDIDDNWIYVHESYVDVGRIQFFNNWSRYLVKDPKKMWIGMEYFCNMGDSLWEKSDKEIINYATTELEKLGFASGAEVEDGIVVKTTKAYPSYTGTYNKFGKIRDYLDKFDNLFLVGRNGMHKYNNQDHSILTAMVAVDNIILERKDKSNIWVVNTESEYHEEKKQTET
jgi:protoporphyrinogen oxidase